MEKSPHLTFVDIADLPPVDTPTPQRRPVVVVSITGDAFEMRLDEVVLLLSHRVVLVFAAFVGFMFSVIDVRTSARHLPIWGEALHQLAMIILSLTLVAAGFYLRARLSKGPALTISSLQITIPLTLVTVFLSEAIIFVRHGPLLAHWYDYAALLFFMCACIEGVMVVAVYAVAPVALADIRARSIARKPMMLSVLGVALDANRLYSVHLIDDQVVLMTDDGPRVAAGAFGRALADLPDTIGLRVHRTCWVAGAGVAGFFRAGRELYILLRNDDIVRVAQSRQPEVLEWLEQVSARIPTPDNFCGAEGKPVRAGMARPSHAA